MSDRMVNILAGVVLIGGLVLIVVIFVMGCVLGERMFRYHYNAADCREFAATTGRETKFAEYTWWSWECLVRTPDGWIPKDQLHAVEVAP